MYESLKENCQAFHLYIFAFNDECCSILTSLQLSNVTVVSQSEFEDEQLLSIKPTRTRGEYCWTCTSSAILYVLNNYDVDHCTYLDADLYFFSSPQPLIDEMGSDSILITPHRYTPAYDQGWKTGIYCVQFVTFKKDVRGLIALNWWREACLNWCYNRFEDGKFGDQKYLDDWTTRFEGVHVLQHLGGGVAPWNMQQYVFEQKNRKLTGKEIQSENEFDVIFFHFHSFMFVTPTYFSARPYYRRNDSVIALLFKPYREKIESVREISPQIKKTEHYLHGWKYILYITEVFVRRGFKEIHYIKLLHQK
jgi:hypothetical protein